MTAPDKAPYLSALDDWHVQRVAALTKPDGWLSVAGLEWVEPGTWRFGSAADNDIVIPDIPEHAGTLSHDNDGTVSVRIIPSANGTIDGEALAQANLSAAEPPTLVAFGAMSFHLIERGGLKALRILNSESHNRRTFSDIPRFPVDPSWRIVASWIALESPKPFSVDSVIGTTSTVLVTHKAVFSHNGSNYELWPTHGTPGAPMFVLRDGTSGTETYGASRFLVGEVAGSEIVLDFNKAINPPCAFTDFATCPLPPPENRLTLRIEAGEKLPRFQAAI